MGNQGLMKSTFKEIPLNDRPREKALNNGVQSLSNEELLAVILKCGTRGVSVLELANDIFKRYYSFNNIMNCSYDELMKIKGISKAKAIELLAIMEIAKRIQKNKINSIKVINSPDDIYDNFSVLLKEEKQENFMVIFLNIKSHIIKYETLFVGGVNCSIIDVNFILKKAINYGACKIICLHNHPSGDPTPSNQDIIITKKIDLNADMLDIKLMDHIIIGKNSYVSLKREKLF